VAPAPPPGRHLVRHLVRRLGLLRAEAERLAGTPRETEAERLAGTPRETEARRQESHTRYLEDRDPAAGGLGDA
jgi:hypothetical protein